MSNETESIAISNDDSTNPIKVSVVQSLSDPTINGIVVCNPDGSSI